MTLRWTRCARTGRHSPQAHVEVSTVPQPRSAEGAAAQPSREGTPAPWPDVRVKPGALSERWPRASSRPRWPDDAPILIKNTEAAFVPTSNQAASEGGWGTLSGEVKEGMARRARGDTSQAESPTLPCSAQAGTQRSHRTAQADTQRRHHSAQAGTQPHQTKKPQKRRDQGGSGNSVGSGLASRTLSPHSSRPRSGVQDSRPDPTQCTSPDPTQCTSPDPTRCNACRIQDLILPSEEPRRRGGTGNSGHCGIGENGA